MQRIDLDLSPGWFAITTYFDGPYYNSRKVSQKYRRLQSRSSKYGSLPLYKRTHKGTMDGWRYLNHVGEKADEHKYVHVCVDVHVTQA